MSTRKLSEAESQFRFAQWLQCMAFIEGRTPAQKLSKREREERRRQYELSLKELDRQVAAELAQRKNFKPPDMDFYKMTYLAIRPGRDWDFIGQRMRELIQHGSNAGQAFQQAFVDLLASDVPIDAPLLRSVLKATLERSYWPEREKQRELENAQWHQDYFANVFGMTPGEAEQKAAETVGLTVEALRKRRTRARKRKPSPR
jgi:hypothetical protein